MTTPVSVMPVAKSAADHDAFIRVIERLNRASVSKRYEAFRDVAWDAPESRIDRHDPRHCLGPENTLGATAWYAALPESQRAELGLEYGCQAFKIGSSFEGVLSRGLLVYSRSLPNRSPEYRYALHEVIEESNHSLMFQQFIDQSGCDPEELGALISWFDRRVVGWATTFPALFFVFVLAGEIFIDYENRERLARRHELHPLLARILQIHVTEEARHVCFAERSLQRHLPELWWPRRTVLRAVLPLIMHGSSSVMSQPTPRLVRKYGIPASVLRAAYGPGSAHRAKMRKIAEPVYALVAKHAASR
jgi:hypothetical protein